MKSQNCFIQFDGIQTDQTYKNLEHVFDVVKWEYHAHRPSPSYYGYYRPTDMYVEHKNIHVEIKTPNTALFDSMFSTKIFDEVIITRFYQEEPFLTVLLKQVVLDRMEISEHENNQDTFPKTTLFLDYEYIQVQSFMNPYGETPLGNDLASCRLDRGYQTQSNSIYVPPPTPPEPTPQEIIMPPLPSKDTSTEVGQEKQEVVSETQSLISNISDASTNSKEGIITYKNDDSTKPDPKPENLTKETLNMIHQVVNKTSLNININSGYRPKSSPRHSTRQAVDINQINGKRVDDHTNKDNVEKLQECFNQHKNIRENFGPVINTKTDSKGKRFIRNEQARTHQNHIHISGQK